MTLQSLTRQELIFPDLPGTDRDSLLQALAARVAEAGLATKTELLCAKLREREELGTTGIGKAVAVPHCRLRELDEVILCVGLHRTGVDFDAADGEAVRLVFLVLAPEKKPAAHLQSLAAISRWVQDDGHVEALLEETSVEAIFARLGDS